MDAASPFLERLRHWFDFERECNGRVIAMLESVPSENRGSPRFARALSKATHIVAARHMWLHRIGICADKPADWFPPTTLEEFPQVTARVERMWLDYLGGLTEADVQGNVEWIGFDGRRRSHPLGNLLTHLFVHGFYHRGQVALLVKDLGGEPVNTDLIMWEKPAVVEG